MSGYEEHVRVSGLYLTGTVPRDYGMARGQSQGKAVTKAVW